MSDKRKLVGILFADIVGYTSLMQKDEKEASAKLLCFQKLLEEKVPEHNGRIVNFYGDGCLCTFEIPLEAVQCSIALQMAFKESSNIPVRIGIHSGTVTVGGDNIFGDSVNIASRIESMGLPGSVLLSKKVRDEVKNNPDLQLTTLGAQIFKNVDEPIIVYALSNEGLVVPENINTIDKSSRANRFKPGLVMAGILLGVLVLFAIWQVTSSGSDKPLKNAKSIAVLPFKNVSPDKDNQYFCDGMMDEVLNHLQNLEDLKVKSRTAVEPFLAKEINIKAVAQELEVRYLLEGAVRKVAENFRITTKLIDALTGDQLWSDTYDGIFSDTIFVVQSNIAKKIAASMHVAITPSSLALIDQRPVNDVRAYDYFIRAAYELDQYWHDRDHNRLEKGHDMIDRALEIQPDYHTALARKGSIYIAQNQYSKAREIGEKLIILEPENQEGYMLLGECANFSGNTDLAIQYYLESVKRSHKIEWSHVQLGNMYFKKHEISKGIRYLKQGLNIEDSALPSVHWSLSSGYGALGDFDREKFHLKKAMELESSCLFSFGLSWMYLKQGDLVAAEQYADSLCSTMTCNLFCYQFEIDLNIINGEIEQALQSYKQLKKIEKSSGQSPLFAEYKIAYLYDQLGDSEKADSIFSEEVKRLENGMQHDPNNYMDLARIHAYKGNKDKALDYLSQYLQYDAFTHEIYAVIFFDPFFSQMKETKEFKNMITEAQNNKAAILSELNESL